MLDAFSGYLYVIVWCPAFGLFNIEVSLFRVYSRNNNIGLWDSVGTDFKV